MILASSMLFSHRWGSCSRLPVSFFGLPVLLLLSTLFHHDVQASRNQHITTSIHPNLSTYLADGDSSQLKTSPHLHSGRYIFLIRGGFDEDEYGEDYDDQMYDDDEDEIPTEGYDNKMVDPLIDNEKLRAPEEGRRKGGPPRGQPSRRRGPPPASRPVRKGKKPPHWSKRMASQTFKMGTSLAWGTVQRTGKVAYQLVKPRHVEARELLGLWRLDQQVSSNGGDLASVATVELDPRKQVVILKLPNGKTVVESYSFRKTRMGSWQTEFVAPAFLVGDTPRLYGYRGVWHRKLADKSVIKLTGKIYTVRKQRFGKEKGKYLFAQPVGTFVARRRLKLSEEDEDDDFESDDEDEFEGEEMEVFDDSYDFSDGEDMV